MKYFVLYPRWRAEEKAQWEQTRRGGKARFVFFFGVLQWGMWCCIGVTLGTTVTLDLSGSEILERFGIGLVVFSLTGLLCGHLIWNATNASYDQRYNVDN